MYRYLILCFAVLTGCATQSVNPWETIDVDETPAVRPDTLPARPIPMVIEEGLLYDRQQINDLDAYFIAAEAAEDIANANADQVNELKRASASLVEAGAAQRRQTEIVREILSDTRRQCAMEKTGLTLLTLLSLGVAATK